MAWGATPRTDVDTVNSNSMKLAQFVRLASVTFALAVSVLAQGPDMSKTIRTYYIAPETAFDPAKYSDKYSITTMDVIFEPLLDFDYLVRPQVVTPRTAELPQILDGGKTYIFKIKPGIYFADDKAFGGKKRELVAQDFVYSLQRVVDPANRGAPWAFFFQGKVIGLDEKIDEATKTGKFDYDKPIEGFKALDRYTLQIKLMKPDYTLPMILATPATSAVAREVMEYYKDDAEAHPVGTGPYMLKEWHRRTRIVLTANPTFRGYHYVQQPGKVVDPSIAAWMKGKTFPIIGNVDIRIIQSGQASWLAFESGQMDLHPELGAAYVNLVAPNGKLAKKYDRFQFFRVAEASEGYYEFNMDDPVVGGYTPERIALRRAVAMAFNQRRMVSVVYNNQAVPMQSPLAPEIAGFDPNFKNTLGTYSPARANALLDIFGYKRCQNDEWRCTPDGKPLTITYLAASGRDTRDAEEMMDKTFRSIGIRLKVDKVNFSDLLKARQAGTYQFAESAWEQDYPDAGDFMPLLYGPNAGPLNESRFRNKEFDRLYDLVTTMPENAERDEYLRQMSRITAAYAPWVYDYYQIRSYLAQPWIKAYYPHPSAKPYWYFLDIDEQQRQASQGK